jgi:hypothetical protein
MKITEANFKRLGKAAIQAQVSKFEYSSAAGANMTMATGAIIITVPCVGDAEIKVRNSIFLGRAQDNPVTIRTDICKEKYDLNLDVDFTGNPLWPHAPSSVLSYILDTYIGKPGIRLKLKLDTIECCLDSNSWLFDRLWKNSEAATIVVPCYDIKGNVADYKDKQALETACTYRNIVPVYLIAIIIFGGLLIVSIIVCVVYKVYFKPKHQVSQIDDGTGTGGSAADVNEIASGTDGASSSALKPSSGLHPKPISVIDTRRQSRKKKGSGSSSSGRGKRAKASGISGASVLSRHSNVSAASKLSGHASQARDRSKVSSIK